MDPRTGLPVVGMVGGGSLARMTHQAAITLGQSLRVLVESPDDSAALVAADVRIGHPGDLATLREFAKGCDVVTVACDRVSGEHLRALAAEGRTVLPGADALRYATDRRAMLARLAEFGAVAPRRSAAVPTGEESPPPGGLVALVARSPFGQVAAYPMVETALRDGACAQVLAPAPSLTPDRAVTAQRLAIDIAAGLEVVGTLAVELVDTRAGLLVNRLVMRPHVAGYWTVDGSRTSQFEQHLRAVLDYPLGPTALLAPAVVTVSVAAVAPGGMSIDERLHHLYAAEPGARVHLHGERPHAGRPVGHVTVLGDDVDDARVRAVRAARWLQEGRDD